MAIKSDLDPVKYGPPESAITKEVVEQQIFMTVEEAISQKKLFILNYHDLLLPYVHKGRGKPQWKHVYRPSWDFTTDWLWKLAKAHV